MSLVNNLFIYSDMILGLWIYSDMKIKLVFKRRLNISFEFLISIYYRGFLRVFLWKFGMWRFI